MPGRRRPSRRRAGPGRGRARTSAGGCLSSGLSTSRISWAAGRGNSALRSPTVTVGSRSLGRSTANTSHTRPSRPGSCTSTRTGQLNAALPSSIQSLHCRFLLDDCGSGLSRESSRDDINSECELQFEYEQRFRVDRKKLEMMMTNSPEFGEAAAEFFERIGEETGTTVIWPSRLKVRSSVQWSAEWKLFVSAQYGSNTYRGIMLFYCHS